MRDKATAKLKEAWQRKNTPGKYTMTSTYADKKQDPTYRGLSREQLVQQIRGMQKSGVPNETIKESLGFAPTESLSEIARGIFSEREMVSPLGKAFPTVLRQPATWDVKEEDLVVRSLRQAQEAIVELTNTLERIQKEPLILYSIDRLSKDGKYAYVKKGDQTLRIMSCINLESGDEVLLHPKTLQIVERIGRPPLEASRFSPDTIPNVTWGDIGGLEQAKADMIEAIELPHQNKELFRFYNKTDIKGILLAGPPGCGKTMLGKAAANSLADAYGQENSRTGFLYVKGPEILDKYVGQTEQTIRDMFFDAKRHKQEKGYPAIIFIDEADAVLAARGTYLTGIGNTIVPAFLTEMDGLEESGAIVIIATNRPQVLDPAIVRDGRIDRKVSVTRPDEESASEILRLNLSKLPLGPEFDALSIARETIEIMYSYDCQVQKGVLLRDIINGAMLVNCLNLAVSFAIRRDLAEKTFSGIRMDDIKAAIHRLQTNSAVVLGE